MIVRERKVCPECGADMTDLDPLGHALMHWPENINPLPEHRGAIARQEAVLAGGVDEAAGEEA